MALLRPGKTALACWSKHADSAAKREPITNVEFMLWAHKRAYKAVRCAK